MARLTFTDADLQALHTERFEHPHPRVQLKMEAIWLISQGLVYSDVARLCCIGEATLDRSVSLYRQGGLDELRKTNWGKSSVSELEQHRESLEESFRKDPPHTVAEACQRIKEETGIERGPTQVRAFLKRLA